MKKLMMALFFALVGLVGAGDHALAEGRRDESAPAAQAPTGTVNINEASPEQLERLPGIGPARARQIVEYRKQHAFKRVEELTRIKGIGKKTFARLRPLVTLSGPTTLR